MAGQSLPQLLRYAVVVVVVFVVVVASSNDLCAIGRATSTRITVIRILSAKSSLKLNGINAIPFGFCSMRFFGWGDIIARARSRANKHLWRSKCGGKPTPIIYYSFHGLLHIFVIFMRTQNFAFHPECACGWFVDYIIMIVEFTVEIML